MRITILAFRASSIGTESTDRSLIAYAITARMVSCCIMIFVGTPSASIAPGTFTQLRAAVLAGIDTGCSGCMYGWFVVLICLCFKLSFQTLNLGLHLLHAEFRFTGFCRLRLCGASSDQKRSNKQQNKYSLYWLHIHTSLPVLNDVVQYNSTPHSAHMSREMGGAH